jgi:hypothetical protein
MAENENGLCDDHYFKLYLQTRSAQIEYINQHSTHFKHHLTIIVAILGLAAASAYHLLGRDIPDYVWLSVAGLLTVNAVLSAAVLRRQNVYM